MWVNWRKNALLLLGILPLFLFGRTGSEVKLNNYALELEYQTFPLDSGDSDEVKLKYPISNSPATATGDESSKMDLGDPSNIKSEVKYNPATGKYEVSQKMGDRINYKPPTYLDFDEYLEMQKKKSMADYWKDKKSAEKEFEEEGKTPFAPQLKIKSKAFDRIFGGNNIDIRPSGSAEVSFGGRISKTDNPVIPIRSRRITTFQFDQNMQLNLIGNIGDKLKVSANYNTQATFDFQNQFKIEYTGYEDEILQKIELGNVSMPLNSQLITGSQSLFGVKVKTQFGRLTMTTVLSQDRGQKSEVESKGGAQISEFEVQADNYEANKHFFLNELFRNNYETAIADPLYLQSAFVVTRIEVWVTNTRTDPAARDVLAFQDLGTANPDFIYRDINNPSQTTNYVVAPSSRSNGIARNEANNLYDDVFRNFGGITGRTIESTIPVLQSRMGLDPRLDFQKVELARLLGPNDYDLNAQLGYISLKQQINSNQVLAVAYEYTFQGEVFRVGEFSNEVAQPTPLLVKMLKSTELNTKVPMWDLMMKNIYSIGAYRVKKDGFKFNVWYLDQDKGVDINFIPQPELNDNSLVQLLGMDVVNFNGQPQQDGIFDFVPNITINTNTGRVIIPRLEPFGDGMRQGMLDKIGNPTRVDELMEIYGFDSLYDNTQADAKVRWPDRNRFSLKGQYQSESSNEISLNALNVPDGSVSVTAGGRQLTENQDYTVDYTLGRVKIINQSIIESGVPVKVALESNQLFAQQQKNFLGHRMDFKVADNFVVGGSLLHLWERPLSQKIDIGYEPISNWVYGIDATYNTDVPFITRMVDAIPLIDTKEMSTFSATAEFAQILPGHSNAIGEDGNAYIDDFEGSQNTIDLRSFNTWFIAATPKFQPSSFPEGNLFNNRASGFNRAKVSWRIVDPVFYTSDAPQGTNDEVTLSNHFMRQVLETEIFPNKEIPAGQPTNTTVLDLSIYPQERGMYNYETDGLDRLGRRFSAGTNDDGTLNDPETRWAGITRRIDQNDFEAANVEYIQFWMMDPFNEDYEGAPATNGQLYFNLGNISEDIMTDGLNLYEQLLPDNEADANAVINDTNSVWGRTTRGTPFADGFDNLAGSRLYQDAGLDGLHGGEDGGPELSYYQDFIDEISTIITANSPEAQAELARIQTDPSSDDYNYFRDDDYDAEGLNILERYKNFNGTEGNSPTQEQYQNQNAGGYSTAATIRPDKEDINADNIVNPVEAYYQYAVNISESALSPENVGSNFISDVLETTVSTRDGRKRQITWYQFRIPVRTPRKTRHGEINDFRSIRFMRMFMKGFSDPMHLRFARLELVRGEWRKYLGEIDNNPEGITTDSEIDFNIGAVNIEENASKIPVNYVLPPQIDREQNVNTTNLQQINEQALQLTVCGLDDGQAVSSFRTTTLDLRQYGTLKMFVHAETLADNDPIENGDMNIFIRLGTDFTDHYYEYELPLVVTQPGRYNNDVESSQLQVWPELNNIEIDLKDLTDLKIARDKVILDGGSETNRKRRFFGSNETGTMYVVGNPNMGEIKTIMIGIRNPRQTETTPNDDGLPKCAEIWVNELRMSNFDRTKGWATVGNANLKMADLVNFNVTAGMSTPGWGSLDKKVAERQQETKKHFSTTAAMNLDRFLPKDWGIKVPMYASYGIEIEQPRYSPLAPDIEFEDYVDAWETRQEKDSVKRITQDRLVRRSVNFTNVRKEKAAGKDKKSMPYDISNFSATYAWSEELRTNFEVERDLTRNQKLALTYQYALAPKPIKPLSKVKMLKESDYMKLASEMNFYLLPKSFSMTSSMNRLYNAYKVRNNNPGLTARLPEFYNKNFTWNRSYNFKYDLTKNLNYTFTANNNALIMEPLNGPAEKSQNDTRPGFENGYWDHWKDTVWTNILALGVNMNYTHNSNFNYKIPLDKIPATDWINSSLDYSAGYTWTRAPLGRGVEIPHDEIRDSTGEIGNTIQNNNTINFSNSFNLRKIYGKSDYLKGVQTRQRRYLQQKARERAQRQREKNTEPDITQNADGDKADDADDKKSKRDPNKYTIIDRGVKLLMSFTNANVTYGLGKGMMIPGFRPNSQYIGGDWDEYGGEGAPGLGFLFGKQTDFGGEQGNQFWEYASEKEWLVRNPNINNQVSRLSSNRLTLRATAEPIKDLRINFSGSYNNTQNTVMFYRYGRDSLSNEWGWREQSPVTSGNYSVSYNMIRTSLVTDDEETNGNVIFDNMLEYRELMSDRVAQNSELSEFIQGEHEKYPGYAQGYGPTSADVLIPAFLAAYSGKDPNLQKLNVLDELPKVNWRVTYNGLSKIPALKKYFKTVTTSTGYTSNLTVGGYTNNQRYKTSDEVSEELQRQQLDDIIERDLDSNFIGKYQFNSVTLSEQFSPLVNVDFQWKNGISTRVEYKTGRTAALNVGTGQIMEQKNKTYTIGAGYSFPLSLPWSINGKKLNSDLKLRADGSYRENRAIVRRIAENEHTPTSGQNVFSLKITADYALSTNLNLRLFYDYVLNIPVISNSFRTANTNFGVSFRFTIG